MHSYGFNSYDIYHIMSFNRSGLQFVFDVSELEISIKQLYMNHNIPCKVFVVPEAPVRIVVSMMTAK